MKKECCKSLEFSPECNFLKITLDDNEVKYWDLVNKVKVSTSFEPEIKFSVIKNSQDLNDINISSISLIYRKSTKSLCSNFLLLHSDIGFDIYDISKRSIVDPFFILNYDLFSISIKINSKIVTFKLRGGNLKLSNLFRDTLAYQKRLNLSVELSRRCINSGSFVQYRKERYNNEILYRGALYHINEERIECLTGIYGSIIISDYRHTLLHLLSYRGDEKNITRMLKDSEKIDIQVDEFGKSPIYYAILGKHQTSAQLILKFLLELKIEDKLKLYNTLSRIQNEFILLVKSSFKELPGLLNRFVFETDYKMIPKIPNLPKLIDSIENNNPTNYLKAGMNAMIIPTIVIYFSTILPIQTYSRDNIELLESLASCSNLRLFENIIIQKIIDYNWEKVRMWVSIYSIFSMLNFIIFILTIVYGRTNLTCLILFLITHSFFFFWEILQFYSIKFEYFRVKRNYIDIFMHLLIIYWIVAGFFDFDSPYEEYILAFFVTSRGINSFRIFDGTRYYFRLVKESLDSIKYFLAIFAYTTLFFSILLFILINKHNNSFTGVWQKSWTLNFTAEFDGNYSASEVVAHLTVIGATILNVILMLNLLISILGDKYDLFMVEKRVFDLKEKIDFSLEIQITLFWKKQYNQSKYFYIISNAFNDGDENQGDDWQGKIMFLEKRQEKKLEELNQKSNELKELMTVALKEKISTTSKEDLNTKINRVEQKISEIDKKIENRMNEVEQKINGVELKIENRMNNVEDLVKKILLILNK